MYIGLPIARVVAQSCGSIQHAVCRNTFRSQIQIAFRFSFEVKLLAAILFTRQTNRVPLKQQPCYNL